MTGKVLSHFLRGRKIFDRANSSANRAVSCSRRPRPERLSASIPWIRSRTRQRCSDAVAARAGPSDGRAAGRLRIGALMAAADEIWWGLLGPDRLARSLRRPSAHRRSRITAGEVRCDGRSLPRRTSRRDATRTRPPCANLPTATPPTKPSSATSSSSAPRANRRPKCWRSCASGCNNDPETELRIAAAEQAKITRLRLEKLCTS